MTPNRKIVQALWETLQLASLLIVLPFRIFFRISYWLLRCAEWAEKNLSHPIYYSIVQAKRRALQLPLWQEQDWMLGIGPPCEYCGIQVPPGKHRLDCVLRSVVKEPKNQV